MDEGGRAGARFLNNAGDASQLVQWLTPEARKRLFAALAASPARPGSGAVRFACPTDPSVDLVTFMADGRVFIRGEEIDSADMLVPAIFQWLAAAGVRPIPGGNLTFQGGNGGERSRGGDVVLTSAPSPGAGVHMEAPVTYLPGQGSDGQTALVGPSPAAVALAADVATAQANAAAWLGLNPQSPGTLQLGVPIQIHPGEEPVQLPEDEDDGLSTES